MLEYSTLLLGAPGPDSRRSILDGESHKVLGFASANRPAGSWSWLSRITTEVREADDAPLVCSVRPVWLWSTRYQVRDAEGYLVGTLVSRFILNEFNRRIAEIHRPANHPIQLQSHRGDPLARLRRDGENWLLEFATEKELDPFLRMLLLAAALRE